MNTQRSPKEIVIEFYNAIARRDFDTIRKLGRADYIQHNPDFEDGLEGLIRTIKASTHPPATAPLQFIRVIAEGDYVMTLRRMPPRGEKASLPGAEMANVDIFRMQDGLIAEHWDYQEQFPRSSAPPKNDNGRF